MTCTDWQPMLRADFRRLLKLITLVSLLTFIGYFFNFVSKTECRPVSTPWAIKGAILFLSVTTHQHHNRFTALFQDHLAELVPEENLWTLWCKGRLTEADTPTIRLGATPSRLTSAHLHHPPFLQAGCPSCRRTVSEHWRQRRQKLTDFNAFSLLDFKMNDTCEGINLTHLT